MKLTITHDDGKEEVFQGLTDLFIAFRQVKRITTLEDDLAQLITSSRSFSWGSDIREIAKEINQASIELQDILRGKRNGNSS